MHAQTSGVDNPERANAPFILAPTSAIMNTGATVYFIIRGVTSVKRGETEKIKIGIYPSFTEARDQTTKTGVKLAVGEQNCSLLGIPRRAFVDEAANVGVA